MSLSRFVLKITKVILVTLTLLPLAASHMAVFKPFEDQVEDLLRRIRLSDQQVYSYLNITKDVQNSLQEKWPGCTITPISSIVTNLALQNSDMDMALDLPPSFQTSNTDLVYQAKEQLQKQSEIYENFLIPPKRVPIVRFVHKPTGVTCDLNFQGYNAYRKADLIKYFMLLDQRAHKLTLIVKYWNKVHKIEDHLKMKSFQIVILVIFYLQHLKILPTIQYLQEGAKVDAYGHWNYGFEPKYYSNCKDLTLYYLMGDFFRYYSTFDFDKYAVSAYLGYPIEKKLFVTLEKLPEGFNLYKHNVEHGLRDTLNLNHLVIQDPFEHNVNIDETVGNNKHFQLKFKEHLNIAADKFKVDSQLTLLKNLLDVQSIESSFGDRSLESSEL